MTRYKSNYSYAQDLRDIRQHGMEIARKLAAEQALVMDLNNQIHVLNVEVERLTDELNLAHEALRRAFSPQ
jgi:flagellar biosynthesis chaperone FliJ